MSKRPGSLTFLLAGLVLLVTGAGLFVTLVPCWGCPLRRHAEILRNPAWACPLCGGYGGNRVTLWRRWTWRPQTPEDWLEVELQERPKLLFGPKLPEEKK
jgi:hypothetical protein